MSGKLYLCATPIRESGGYYTQGSPYLKGSGI